MLNIQNKRCDLNQKRTRFKIWSVSWTRRERRASHPPKPTNFSREKKNISSLFCHKNGKAVNLWLAYKPPPIFFLKQCYFLKCDWDFPDPSSFSSLQLTVCQ